VATTVVAAAVVGAEVVAVPAFPPQAERITAINTNTYNSFCFMRFSSRDYRTSKNEAAPQAETCSGAGRSATKLGPCKTELGNFQQDVLSKNCTGFCELGKEFILWNIGY
jgi:hypothetical protein